MRFPFSLVRSMAWYMMKCRLRGERRFPLVLMLEPLHACNLHCRGCGRVREYADTLHKRMTLEECLAAVRECPAPTVSLCGGEPLIYPEIVPLVEEILASGRHIYLCTNGQKMSESVPLFTKLPRRERLFWNVHLDGTAPNHDAIVEKDGAFDRAIEGIRAAKAAGFRVYTNTTVYSTTSVGDLVTLSEQLRAINIDGMMIAPAFGYASVIEESASSSDFLTREQTHKFFTELRKLIDPRLLTATPAYLDFLCGLRPLPCAAWANPTCNIKGWKSPCYLVTDKHCDSYHALINETDWTQLGWRPNGDSYDPRCEHCLMHCGFEPSAVLNVGGIGPLVTMVRWMFST
ncbi:MAG: adenosyl-hopene transferase HpnH [Thermoguttaceae bacterium]